jgi:hypothetical protein
MLRCLAARRVAVLVAIRGAKARRFKRKRGMERAAPGSFREFFPHEDGVGAGCVSGSGWIAWGGRFGRGGLKGGRLG